MLRMKQRSCVPARLAAYAAGIAILSLAVSAAAQPARQKDAKSIVDDAVSQYNLGHYAESAAKFEKAYQLDPAPILLFNIGQCHRRLGNHDLALFFYRRYLEQAPPDAAERADVEKRVADLERTIRQQAELKDKPPPGVGSDTSHAKREAAPPVATGTGLSPVSSPPAREVDAPRNKFRTAAWVVGGIAAASLIFGGAEGIVWSNRADRFNNHVGSTTIAPGSSRNCGADEPNRGGAGCAALYDDVSSARTLSIVGLAAGGLLAAGAVILFATSAPRPYEVGQTAFESICVANLFTPGVACHVSF